MEASEGAAGFLQGTQRHCELWLTRTHGSVTHQQFGFVSHTKLELWCLMRLHPLPGLSSVKVPR